MIFFFVVVCVIVSFLIGRFFGFREGIDHAHEPVALKIKEVNALLDHVKEIECFSEKMKSEFAQAIREKIQIKVLIKDENNVIVETLEL